MAITPVNTTLTVAAAGTEVQCTSDTDIKPSSIYFEADAANTGYIYIGLSDVSSSKYITRLSAGQGFLFQSDNLANGRLGSVDYQLSNLYVDASVNGEKVFMTHQFRVGV